MVDSLATNDRLALVGKTGSGKTFLAERLVKPVKRLVVYDPKGNLYGRWGLTEWSGKTARLLRRGEPLRVRVPGPGPAAASETVSYWEAFSSVIYDAKDVTLYIDEIYGVVPPRRPAGPFLTVLYTQGRELGIGVWGATQRPSMVPIFCFSEAEWTVQFELTWPNDRKRMAEWIHPMCMVNPPYEHGFYLMNNRWREPKLYRKVGA